MDPDSSGKPRLAVCNPGGAGNASVVIEQNRWTTLATVLTGEIPAFACAPQSRSDPAFKTEQIALKQKTLAEHAQPMPLQVSEGQMETLVGTAIKNLLAQAAQGKSVSEADVKAALEDANSQMTASQ